MCSNSAISFAALLQPVAAIGCSIDAGAYPISRVVNMLDNMLKKAERKARQRRFCSIKSLVTARRTGAVQDTISAAEAKAPQLNSSIKDSGLAEGAPQDAA